MDVRIPGNAVDTSAMDLAEPVAEFLRAVNLQSPSTAESENVSGFDLIKSNASDLSKWVAGLIGAAGAALTGTAGVTASQVGGPLRIALVGATALVAVATLVSVAWVVATELQERARTQRARYDARSRVIDDYFDVLLHLQRQPGEVPQQRQREEDGLTILLAEQRARD